jgi:hypothetical protein
MPLGLMIGRPFRPFTGRSHGSVRRRSASGRQDGYLTAQFRQQRFKLCTVQRGKGGGRRHMTQKVDRTES